MVYFSNILCVQLGICGMSLGVRIIAFIFYTRHFMLDFLCVEFCVRVFEYLLNVLVYILYIRNFDGFGRPYEHLT